MNWDSLSDEQLRIADKVRKEAIKQGVDPNLALNVAFKESGFKHVPNASGKSSAYGVMQLTQGTAKDLGVDPSDVNSNIIGGVRLLKKHMDQFKDPKLAVAAYHEGPNSNFFKTGSYDDLSDEGLKYLKGYYTSGYFSDEPEKKEVAPAPGEAPAEAPTQPLYSGQELGNAAAVGGTGAALAVKGQALFDAGKFAVNANQAVENLAKPPVPAGVVSGAGIPNEAQVGRQLYGTGAGNAEGLSGRARQTAYNEETSRIAREKNFAQGNIEKLKAQGVLTGENPILRQATATTTQSGILLPRGGVESEKIIKEIADKAVADAPKPPSTAGALAKGAAKYGARALGGAGIALSGVDAYDSWKQKNYPKMAADIAGVVGGGLTMTGAGAIVGIPLSMIPLFYDALDRADKQAKKRFKEGKAVSKEYSPSEIAAMSNLGA